MKQGYRFTVMSAILGLSVVFLPAIASADMSARINVGYNFTKTLYVVDKSQPSQDPPPNLENPYSGAPHSEDLQKTEQYSATQFELTLTSDDLNLSNYKTYGYCVEIDQSISSNREGYNYLLTSLSSMDSDTYYKIAWLVDQYAPGEGLRLDNQEQEQAAALQGAIWSLLYGDSFSVQNEGQIGTLYSQYLAAAGSLVLTDDLMEYLNANYMIAINSDYQDLIVAVANTVPVPLPGSATLLGLGLLTTVIQKRRKRAKDQTNI